MKLRRNLSSLAIQLVTLVTTVAFTGCHNNAVTKRSNSVLVGTHLVKVDRTPFHLATTNNRRTSDSYKFAEHSPFGDFEFILTGDRVAIDGRDLGLVKPNDEITVDDKGVVVKRADTNTWMDHDQTKTYLAENAKPVTAQK